MKKLRQLVKTLLSGTIMAPGELNDTLWQLICYPPKMPLRLQQEQLLKEAEPFSLTVNDDYFSKKPLHFNGFRWGNGRRKVIITHGWGSKAADFMELIPELLKMDDLQVIAFDAPGNGSSEGGLSNLLLFVGAVEAVIDKFGVPDILIGHSFGAMANVNALQNLKITPKLLISIAPLIRLKENFIASMNGVHTNASARESFLDSFEDLFGFPAAYHNLKERYLMDENVNHLLFYDQNDPISPNIYIQEFLMANPTVKSIDLENAGHERIIKTPELINTIVKAAEQVI